MRSRILNLLEITGDVGLFGMRVVRNIFHAPFEIEETGRQIVEIGTRSVPLIVACGLAIGVVMSLHTRASMTRFGAASMIPAVLTIAMFRELGPLVTGLLVSGRVGAGIGSELAGMRVTEQIDAMESLGVDSFKYLVVTRVAACIVALPVLTILMDFAGATGGLLAEMAVSHSSARLYVHRAFASMVWSDYIPTTLKTTVFGLLIGTISSFLGYTATQGAAGVGRASTRSVVFSSLVLILFNIILVKLLLFWFPAQSQ
jgi:phospholipid/cholesterol/gamma-HCH transport system permease protein